MASTEIWIQKKRKHGDLEDGYYTLTTLLFSFPHPLTHNTSLGFKSSKQVKYLARAFTCGLYSIFQLFVRLPSFTFVSKIQADIPSTSPPFYLTHTHNKTPLQITPECVRLFTHYAVFTPIPTECNASLSNAIIRLSET